MITKITHVICDKCNKIITDNKYYTVSVEEHKIENEAGISIVPLNSISTFVMPAPERHYCSECIKAIREVL